MWHALRREGIDIGREHTARLMRLAGVSDKSKGRSPITTRKPNGPNLRPDLVNREFKAPGPNRLGVVGCDAHFRRCRCKHSIRRPKSAKETTGLIHYSDHGLQYVSIVYNERLAEHGIAASTGTVSDSYDNAVAESQRLLTRMS